MFEINQNVKDGGHVICLYALNIAKGLLFIIMICFSTIDFLTYILLIFISILVGFVAYCEGVLIHKTFIQRYFKYVLISKEF